MILILVLTLSVLILIEFIFNHSSFFSISFMTIISFLIASIVYCIFFDFIGHNISFKTYITITLSCIALMIGEHFGKKIRINLRIKNHKACSCTNKKFYYDTSIKKMVSVFIIMLMIFLVRFMDLYRYSLSFVKRF